MTSQELRRLLQKHGCTFEPGRGGHLTVRLGDKISTLPVHGNKRDLPTGTVKEILKALDLERQATGDHMRYPVTITPDDGQFTVTFPDVPGAVTFGETRQEALHRAQDALLSVFDAYMKDRRDIPDPSPAIRSTDTVDIPALDCTKIELYRAMRDAHVGKAELAKRLDWHLPQVDRVLKVKHGSQFDHMEAAFAALGKRLVIAVEDEPGHVTASAGTPRPYQRASSLAKQWTGLKRPGRPTVHARVLMHSRSGRTTVTGHVVAGRRAAARKAAKKR